MPTEFKLGLNILRTFKTQQNRHHFALGEFIDNSVQSYMDNKEIQKDLQKKSEMIILNNS